MSLSNACTFWNSNYTVEAKCYRYIEKWIGCRVYWFDCGKCIIWVLHNFCIAYYLKFQLKFITLSVCRGRSRAEMVQDQPSMKLWCYWLFIPYFWQQAFWKLTSIKIFFHMKFNMRFQVKEIKVNWSLVSNFHIDSVIWISWSFRK